MKVLPNKISMIIIDNKIKIIGQMACKNHKEDFQEADLASRSPILYYINTHPYHDVFDLGDKLVYKCPKYKEFRKIGKKKLLHMSGSPEFKWIEDALYPVSMGAKPL